MVYKIEEKTTFSNNDINFETKINFDLEAILLEKDKENRIYSINRKKVNRTPEIENNFVNLLSELEDINYPIKVKTNHYREFIQIVDFENWLKEWKIKAVAVFNNHEIDTNIQETINNYYEIIQDEALFVTNKFKEPFWNLFFFKPPIDSIGKPNLGTAFNWNIKSIGSISCQGRTKLLETNPGESISVFESSQKIPDSLIEKLKKTTNKVVSWEDQKINLQTESHSNFIEMKNNLRKASFQLNIEDVILYQETVTITLID